jgi:transcriptional regulator with XRE-family HTH domain
MSEKIKQIAMRIKALREIAGTSIDELAKEFKITKETYKKYESGR